MNRQGMIAAGIVLLIVVLVWVFWPRREPESELPPATVAPTAPPLETLEEPPADPLPPLDASDELAGEALRAAGAAGGPLAAAVDQDNLVRRFVTAVARVAQGRSPRAQVGFLEPDGQFRAAESDGALVIDERSFARYEPLTRALGAIDSDAAVERYARLEPLFQEAYAELGVEGSFRVVLLQALDHLLAVPVPALPIELEDRVEYYALVDPELEGLTDAQKHLLRFGPQGQSAVQSRLRELRAGVARLP